MYTKKFLIVVILISAAACQGAAVTSIPGSASGTPPNTPNVHSTATKSPTPTPAHSPTPIPMFFTEEFDTDLYVWTHFQTGGESVPELIMKNGHARLDIPSPFTWFYLIHEGHIYQDVFLTAKFTGTPSGSMGLVCRYSEGGWYEFNLASDGTYSVLFGQWLEEGIAQYTPITHEGSEYLKAGNLSYEIGLTCQQGFLLLHVNGKLFRKIDVARYGLTEGKIGISAASFDEIPMIASFDWVKVSEAGQ